MLLFIVGHYSGLCQYVLKLCFLHPQAERGVFHCHNDSKRHTHYQHFQNLLVRTVVSYQVHPWPNHPLQLFQAESIADLALRSRHKIYKHNGGKRTQLHLGHCLQRPHLIHCVFDQ
uniref:AlNc14C275G10030 protein n=1 Tax=Albugo laibachii Nc14 TaxID=890382 RepID=F0WUM2_9STRA|nr:AlNc14C275G10030 [Albugo laibachii Nc14]|eukprot:CCA25103.1 AlNc14C275G10030 [Albugo laibachii Nc14]